MAEEPESKAWLVHKVIELLDPGFRSRLLGEAGEPLREFVRDGARDGGAWVPTALLIETLVLAERIAGPVDVPLPWQLGRRVAKSEIGPVQEIALRVLRPSMLMSLAPGLFGTHFRNSGRVALRPTGEQSLVVSFTGFAMPHRVHCMALGGWMEGWLGLGPRRSIRIEHVACRCDGASSCDYTAAWEE